MIYLLDTDSLIHLVRGLRIADPKSASQKQRVRSAQKIFSHCRDTDQKGDIIGLSAITVAELEYGARRSDNYEGEISAIRKIITPFAIFDFDAVECTRRYGQIRSELEREGAPIGSMDMLIAAQAMALAATLVSCNTREFARIPGLSCQDWTK